MTVKEDLIAAKALIATREQWTVGAYARDAQNQVQDTQDPEACKFCALGALLRIADCNSYRAKAALQAFFDVGFNIVVENDNNGFEAVHAAFDLAIERAP